VNTKENLFPLPTLGAFIREWEWGMLTGIIFVQYEYYCIITIARQADAHTMGEFFIFFYLIKFWRRDSLELRRII